MLIGGVTIFKRERALAVMQAEAIAQALAAVLPSAASQESYDQLAPLPYEQIIAGAAPGAGRDYEYDSHGDTIVLPLSVMCRLTTSAAVADRSVAVEYLDGTGTRFLVAGAPVTVAAGQAQTFCWQPTAGTYAWPIEDAALAPLPSQSLYSGCALRIHVWNGDAGDVLDQIRIAARFTPQ
jgi:hypothetical protein